VTFKDGTTTLGSSPLNSSGVSIFPTSSLAGGPHSITAVYGGDTKFSGSTSSVLAQTVSPAGSSTALASSLNPSTYGASVKFTATVTPSSGTATPTGSVTFKDGANSLGTVALSGGAASFSTSSLSVGSHTITANYSGDSNYSGGASGVLTQTVNQASTATTVSSSANPSAVGQNVTFTATVSPSAATGTVQFYDSGATLGIPVTLSGGKASLSTSTLSKGTHSITATYSGDTNYSGSTSSTFTQNVSLIGTATSLTSSPNPSRHGQMVTFTATVTPTSGTGTPTGTVTFLDGSTTLGSPPLNSGVATFSTSSLSTGTHSITAQYGGDTNYGGSTSAVLSQTVRRK
jgi:hypothetical protein